MPGGRKGQYLFKRTGSQNWWLRLQESPPNPHFSIDPKWCPRKRVMSLGTPDRAEAEVRAADWIKLHKLHLFMARRVPGAGADLSDGQVYKPGFHTLPDGITVHATETTLTYYNADGTPTGKIEPNLELRVTLHVTRQEYRDAAPAFRPKKTNSEDDTQFIRDWITLRDIGPYLQKEAF